MEFQIAERVATCLTDGCRPMTTTALSPTKGRRLLEKLLWFALLLLGLAYLAQLATPLRLNTDAYRLLSLAVSSYEGHGFLVDGKPDQFPLLYPLAVRLLLEAGIANAATLVALNLACLAVGLWLLWGWARRLDDEPVALLCLLAVLLSWVGIKHITLPLSEWLYLAFSLLAVGCGVRYHEVCGVGKWAWLGASLLLAILALQTRTVGLTLLPAWLLMAVFHPECRREVRRLLRHRGVWLALAAGAAVVVVVVVYVLPATDWYRAQFERKGSYFQNLLLALNKHGPIAFGLRNASFRLEELGSLFVNLPPGLALRVVPGWGLMLLGLAGWGVVLRGAWLLVWRGELLPVVLYFLVYMGLMLIWPYADTRFWIPLLPLVALLSLVALRDAATRWQALPWGLGFYLTAYAGLGLLALGYSTYISYSGPEFSETYGDGSDRMTYRQAHQNGYLVEPQRVDPAKLRLLEIFDPATKTATASSGD